MPHWMLLMLGKSSTTNLWILWMHRRTDLAHLVLALRSLRDQKLGILALRCSYVLVSFSKCVLKWDLTVRGRTIWIDQAWPDRSATHLFAAACWAVMSSHGKHSILVHHADLTVTLWLRQSTRIDWRCHIIQLVINSCKGTVTCHIDDVVVCYIVDSIMRVITASTILLSQV